MKKSVEDLPVPKYSQRKILSREIAWAPKEIKRTQYMDSFFDKDFLKEYFSDKIKEKSIQQQALIHK